MLNLATISPRYHEITWLEGLVWGVVGEPGGDSVRSVQQKALPGRGVRERKVFLEKEIGGTEAESFLDRAFERRPLGLKDWY